MKQIKTLDELNNSELERGEEIQVNEDFFKNLMIGPKGRIVYAGKEDNVHLILSQDQIDKSILCAYSINSEDGLCRGRIIQPTDKYYIGLMKIYLSKS